MTGPAVPGDGEEWRVLSAAEVSPWPAPAPERARMEVVSPPPGRFSDHAGEIVRMSNHATGQSIDVTIPFEGLHSAALGRALGEALVPVSAAFAEMGRAYRAGMRRVFLQATQGPLRVPIRTGGLAEYPNRAAHRRALRMASYKRRQLRKTTGTDKIAVLARGPWTSLLINHAHVTHRHTWTYDAYAE